MPLASGKSKAAFSHNVEVEVEEGKPQKQAVAIAYSKKGEDIEVDCRDAKPGSYPRGQAPTGLERQVNHKWRVTWENGSSGTVNGANREAAMQRAQQISTKPVRSLEAMDIEIDCKDVAVPSALDEAAPRVRLAFDRSASMRTKDVDGRMHVKDCRISKANICPYLGREIPDSEKMGLESDKVYRLYREAAALQAAAPTFERVPLMMRHVATTAAEPQKETIIGAVSNVRWQAPYLVADLTVWDAAGIEAIESERQQELSPGYRYTPSMVAGNIDGDPYDGLMLSILANHVAIVDTGRTGPDVMVNDRNSLT